MSRRYRSCSTLLIFIAIVVLTKLEAERLLSSSQLHLAQHVMSIDKTSHARSSHSLEIANKVSRSRTNSCTDVREQKQTSINIHITSTEHCPNTLYHQITQV